MSDIHTIKTSSQQIKFCPTFVIGEDELPETCGAELKVIVTINIVGDDYGSWEEYSVGFECGHTLKEMNNSLKHADEI
jgi:hypothetical protein